MIFPAVRMLLSSSWKQLFAAGSSTFEAKQKSFKQKSSCRVPTLAQSSNRYWNGMGVMRRFNAWCNCILLLSCDKVLNLICTANFLASEETVWTLEVPSLFLPQPGNEANFDPANNITMHCPVL